MEIVGALILFIVFIFAYLIIVEIFVVLFKLTGLNDEKSRFQVISILTNTGYTTQEAELVVHNRTRRKLARFLMLFGYAFTVTIVSIVVNIFLQSKNKFIGGAIAFIPIFITFLLIIFFVKRNNFIKNMVNGLIEKLANLFIYHGKANNIIIIEEFDDLTIASINLNIMPKMLVGVDLQESNLKKDYDINVLFKKEDNTEVLPNANTTFEVGDNIIVMGPKVHIREVFDLKEPDEENQTENNK